MAIVYNQLIVYTWEGLVMGLVLLILILVVLYVHLHKHTDASSDALEILKMRFVKGEITEEDYINKKNILMKK